MHGPDRWLTRLIESDPSDSLPLLGGLFLDHLNVPASFVRLISPESFSGSGSGSRSLRLEALRRGKRVGGEFLSVSLSIKRGDHGDSGYVRESGEVLGQNGNKSMEEEEEEEAAAAAFKEEEKVRNVKAGGPYAMNVTKHLWAGAVSAMVSRFAFCFYLFIF
jgi:hypothetical protein